MIPVIITIIVGTLTAGLTGPVQTFFARHANRIRQRRSLARLQEMYKEGDIIWHLYAHTGAGSHDYGRWFLKEMSMGRVVLSQDIAMDDLHWIMTCQEFEKMHVVLLHKRNA